MKMLQYLLGAGILLSSIDLIIPLKIGDLYACPRCRRALPKGPRKRPHPNYSKTYLRPENNIKENTTESPSCSLSSCCCSQKQKKDNINE